MLIKVNGLGATLAFMKSKGNTYDIIYAQIGEWLKADEKNLIEIENELVESVISLDSPDYRMVTNEVLAFLNWLRRFAEGLIEEDVDSEQEENEKE
ncbi:type III-B CRISPR module-associated protein Cmr5 [Caloranaerobacter azorensis]|uniref:CRISPR type III-B/RAMP module-associated protein Cmr5 n=2 Tax=Caloranaerobacter azorensis TaxID=116090 RepID=A0A6P1YDT5_9FIRM|nr:type III-B CRISPR module-associated protein Cmr5 [Caloranaerobacter azorensis]